MKLKSYLPLALTICVLSLLAFIFLAVKVSSHKISKFDDHISSWIQSFESPVMTHVMKLFTFIGSIVPVIFISVILLFLLYKVFHRRTELYLYIIVLAGNTLLNQALKIFFHRARPDVHRLVQETGYSFPSGHSMTAFAMYGVVAFLLWKHVHTWWGRSLLIFASILFIIFIGVSRIYLGVHYPSDVAGSYLFSTFWLISSTLVYQRYLEKHYSTRSNQSS